MDTKKLEEQLVQKLTEGEIQHVDIDEAARIRLPMKTEIRISAHIDPVVEETKQYRKMAEEVDDRYARYDRLVEGDVPEGKKDS